MVPLPYPKSHVVVDLHPLCTLYQVYATLGDGEILKEKIQYEVDFYDEIQNLPLATKSKVIMTANGYVPCHDKFVDGFLKFYHSSDPKDRKNHRESL